MLEVSFSHWNQAFKYSVTNLMVNFVSKNNRIVWSDPYCAIALHLVIRGLPVYSGTLL